MREQFYDYKAYNVLSYELYQMNDCIDEFMNTPLPEETKSLIELKKLLKEHIDKLKKVQAGVKSKLSDLDYNLSK